MLSNGVYNGFFLIEMAYDGIELNYTSLPYDVTINGVTYSSDNNLVSLDPPRLSNTTDREVYKIAFADPDFDFAPASQKMLNSRITIRGGWLNVMPETILDSDGIEVEVNYPILNLKDTLMLYRGFIDVVRYNINEESGVIFQIECASPMANLDALTAFYTTKDCLRQRVPAAVWNTNPDTAFDNISLGGHAQEILWGKI